MPPYAYVACIADDALTIIDIGNPAAPVFTGGIQGPGVPNWLDSPRSVFVRGIYAYVSSSGAADSLSIFNISNPAAPIFVGNIRGAGELLSGARGAFILGNYAYVCAYDIDILTIIDISNPVTPVRMGHIAGAGAPPGGNWLWGPERAFVRGNYAYVAVYSENALTIINVSNPAIPTFAGSVQTDAAGWLSRAAGVFVRGNYAYVAATSLGASGFLTIIDISNPAAPALVSTIQGAGAPPGGNWLRGACDVIIRDNYAYVVATTDTALTIIDISNPLVPVFTGSIQGAAGFEISIMVRKPEAPRDVAATYA